MFDVGCFPLVQGFNGRKVSEKILSPKGEGIAKNVLPKSEPRPLRRPTEDDSPSAWGKRAGVKGRRSCASTD